MKKHWQYLKYIARHKYYVLLAGMRFDVPLWRLLIHDWSKFLPSEWTPYVENFYGTPWEEYERRHMEHWEPPPFISEAEMKTYRQAAFDRAWLLHQNRQPHHWQFWLLVNDRARPASAFLNLPEGVRSLSNYDALPMPEVFVREMVADWLGTGKAITGKWEAKAWYAKNKQNILLHPKSRALAEELLNSTAASYPTTR